jgi:hypothetical protein
MELDGGVGTCKEDGASGKDAGWRGGYDGDGRVGRSQRDFASVDRLETGSRKPEPSSASMAVL